MLHETEKTEFKSIATDAVYKTVVAFANTDGGTLLIGMSDDGEAAPLSDVDDALNRITNGIRDAIAPDVTIFTKYSIDANQVLHIEIGEGSYKPYYLKSKGLKPSGVYVRQGASSVQASPEQIRWMIKNADGDAFEELRSIEQELTFRYCMKAFTRHGIEFDKSKYHNLGIRSHTQQLYTNLGLLLSDQCMHTIKVAVFADERNTVFRDRKEFSGSVLEQLDETFQYLRLCNKNSSSIDGLDRVDSWDYPEEAIREALLNALAHRDYGFSGSIIINVNDFCMEFISIGGLLPGISTEDIRNGISQLRNKKLADVLHRLHFIEAYGTGIRRIFSLYENCPEMPILDVTQNSFKLTLFNMNTMRELPVEPNIAITPQIQSVLDHLKYQKEMTYAELQSYLGIKKTRSFMLTKQMEDMGLIRIEGRGASRKIRL